MRGRLRLARARRVLPELSLSGTPTTTAAEGSLSVPCAFQAQGGASPYTFDVTGLPAGMTADPVNASTIRVTGAPEEQGTFDVVVSVEDDLGVVKTLPYTLTVGPSITELAPGAAYNGLQGSVAGAPTVTRTRWPTAHITSVAATKNDYIAVPEAPGMCTIVNLFKPLTTFTDRFLLVFDADASSGINRIEVWMEGGLATLNERQEFAYQNARGGTSKVRGFGIEVSAPTLLAQAVPGTIASALVYATAYANDEDLNPPRTIGPFLLHAAAPGVGAGKEFDVEIELDSKLALDIPGQKYKDPNAAMLWCNQNGKVRPRFHFSRSYDPADPTTAYKGFQATNLSTRKDFATTLAVFEPDVGVNARWGDYTATSGAPGFDGILIRGVAGGSLELDLLGMAPGTSTGAIGGVWRGHTNSFNVFYLEGVKVFDGAIPAENGGTGSGSRALKWGYDRNGYWLSRQKIEAGDGTTGAQPLHFIAIDVEAEQLSQYGLGFGELLLNSTLRDCSGSGIEGHWGATQGCKVSRVGGIHSGFRQHIPLSTVFPPVDGATYEFEMPGNNGASSRTVNVYRNGVKTTLTLDTSQTSTSTQPVDILAWLEGLGWTSTGVNPDTILAGAYLSVPSNLPKSPISRQVVTSAGLQLTTIADIHANGQVWDNSQLFHNVYSVYNVFYEVNTAALVTAAELTNSTVHNNVYQSSAFIESGATEQPSVISRASVLCFYANTLMGNLNAMQLASNVTWDPRGRFDRNYFDTMLKATSDPDLVFEHGVLRRITLPSGSVDSVALGSPGEETLFVNPTSLPPDARPLPGKLLTPLGEQAGALLPDGSWNPA